MDIYLTIGAIIFEFGVPILLAYLSFKFPGKKHVLIPMLGAVTPLILFYLLGAVEHLFLNTDEPSMYMAAFIMSFAVYCLFLIVGFILGVFLPKSLGLNWRYSIGFLFAPICGLGLSVLW